MIPQPTIAEQAHPPCIGRPHPVIFLALLFLVSVPLVLSGCGTTLQPTAAAPHARPEQQSRVTATSSTPINLTETQASLTVTLKVTPDAYGPNQFGVVLFNTTPNQPIEGASVQLVSTSLDMDMGTTHFDLPAQGQGFYLSKSDLSMGGHWQVVVELQLPSDPSTRLNFTFLFTAAIWAGATG